MAKIKAWTEAGRRNNFGEKVMLVTLEGFGIKPRKYSVDGAEEIQEATVKRSSLLPADILKKVTPLYGDEKEKKIPTIKDFMEVLEGDDLQKLVEVMGGGGETPYEIQRLTLLHGIGEHNFTDDEDLEVWVTKVPESLIDELLEFPDTSAEILAIIQGHNSPLE